MKRTGVTVLASLAISLAVSTGAQAHPHVWIDAGAVLRYEERKLAAVELSWAFDGLFSTILYEDFDIDRDGVFNDEEIEEMRAGAFAGLSQVGFFTDLRLDGERVDWGLPSHFEIEARDGGATVVYSFTLNLPEPIDPAGKELTLALYDPDFYVWVDLDKADRVSVQGREGGNCLVTLTEDTDMPLYYDSFFPSKATIACADT